MLNGDGVVVKRLGAVLKLTPSEGHLIAWGPTEASMISRDGTMIARWELPALTLSQQERPALAIEQAALLFSNDWTFQARDNGI